MKKLIMTFVMVLTTVMLAGCSKVSKYESLTRESIALAQKIGGSNVPKFTEEQIQKDIEEFKKLSSEEQDKRIKLLEASIDLLKTQGKK
jgi:outer membrane murein-binding lipoprotein Lpp